MVLPSSGSLSYNTIRAEFGSPSSNVYLSLYYRGGPYTYQVPRNNSITTNNTGTISVNNFYGAAGKGDYARGVFGSYNSGGKFATIYTGCGGPNLPGMADTSLRTNVFSTGFTQCYASAVGINPGSFTMGPFAPGNQNSSRTYYFYNSAGAQQRQFTWRAGAPSGSGSNTTESTLQPAPRTQMGPGPFSGTFVTSTVPWNIGVDTTIRGF